MQDTTERTALHRQLFDALMEKLKCIPPKRRVPLLLHLALGYSVREISEINEVSPNTVRHRLKMAFREFQTVLDENPALVSSMLEALR
jgi:DNA-directed RNA polymerase specialized sigma24 family protein